MNRKALAGIDIDAHGRKHIKQSRDMEQVYAFWTRILFVEREFSVLKFPLNWFIHQQFPNLVRAITRRPNAHPLHLLLAELKGRYVGPWAYFSSKKRLKKR